MVSLARGTAHTRKESEAYGCVNALHTTYCGAFARRCRWTRQCKTDGTGQSPRGANHSGGGSFRLRPLASLTSGRNHDDTTLAHHGRDRSGVVSVDVDMAGLPRGEVTDRNAPVRTWHVRSAVADGMRSDSLAYGLPLYHSIMISKWNPSLHCVRFH